MTERSVDKKTQVEEALRTERALKLALGYMDGTLVTDHLTGYERKRYVMEALREALAEQPAQDQGQSCYCPECERLSKELDAIKAQQQCPTCNGNDGNRPCAYPSEGMPGCLRDARLKPAQQQCMEHGECFGGECIYPAPQPAQDALVSALYSKIDYLRGKIELLESGLVQAKRTWVGLTPEEEEIIYRKVLPHGGGWRMFLREANAKLKEKNQ